MKDVDIKVIVEKHTTDGVVNYEAINAEIQSASNDFANNLIKGKLEKNKDKTLKQLNEQMGTSYASFEEFKALKSDVKKVDQPEVKDEAMELVKTLQEEITSLKTNLKAKDQKTLLNKSEINDDFKEFADYEAKKLMKSDDMNYADALNKVKEKFNYISKTKPNLNVGKETKNKSNTPDTKTTTKKKSGLKNKFKI